MQFKQREIEINTRQYFDFHIPYMYLIEEEEKTTPTTTSIEELLFILFTPTNMTSRALDSHIEEEKEENFTSMKNAFHKKIRTGTRGGKKWSYRGDGSFFSFQRHLIK